MTRNITLSLDEITLKEARVLAAHEGLSVSALLRRELNRLVEKDRNYTRAMESALRRLSRGTPLGGGPYPRREDLYDRAKLR